MSPKSGYHEVMVQNTNEEEIYEPQSND
jgi:hypothetical protein